MLDSNTCIEFRLLDLWLRVRLEIIVEDSHVAGVKIYLGDKPVEIDYFRMTEEKK